ncbi:MAG TPA: hypothetical protein VJZ00_08855 [Thermoanaerobaculia bacterium]|nr:hypothetical protein [Thermoanaerobaculia bacterium]
MDSRPPTLEEAKAQLNRPVRDEGPAPPAVTKGPPFGIYGCLGLALIVVVAAILGFSGLANAWVVAGLIVVAGGLALTVKLMRQNRGA